MCVHPARSDSAMLLAQRCELPALRPEPWPSRPRRRAAPMGWTHSLCSVFVTAWHVWPAASRIAATSCQHVADPAWLRGAIAICRVVRTAGPATAFEGGRDADASRAPCTCLPPATLQYVSLHCTHQHLGRHHLHVPERRRARGADALCLLCRLHSLAGAGWLASAQGESLAIAASFYCANTHDPPSGSLAPSACCPCASWGGRWSQP